MAEAEPDNQVEDKCPEAVCPGGWHCALCQPLQHLAHHELLDHIRVLHPEHYGDGPARWPDGGLVIEDTTLEPRDFLPDEPRST